MLMKKLFEIPMDFISYQNHKNIGLSFKRLNIFVKYEQLRESNICMILMIT